jgi:hypothetical protein
MSSSNGSVVTSIARILLIVVGVAVLGICGLYAQYRMNHAAKLAALEQEMKYNQREIDRSQRDLDRLHDAMTGKKPSEPVPVRVVP